MSLQNTAISKHKSCEPNASPKSIEITFPIAQISLLAERESWRKEIFRPIYHIHKWWANRLGSVFRAIILGAVTPSDQDIWDGFYRKHDFSNKIILDPFMGSGTTLGEATKLGAKVIGCDINPISTFAVSQALTRVDFDELKRHYLEIENDVGAEISRYYTTLDPETGKEIPVLYYFWVKVLETPSGESIPLFSSYVFSKNAYPKKKPQAQIICPYCWEINTARFDLTNLTCIHCNKSFNPQKGTVDSRYLTDSEDNRFEIKRLLSRDHRPPAHRLYAIMALRENGEKVYLTPRQYDFDLVEQASEQLKKLSLPLPTMPVRTGHNTDQARNYHYLHWRDFFNDRQLLCLGILLKRILKIENRAIREQLLCLFSSTLEYNNLFCSFKGEGTGAVRPLFSHHILKPERTPLENNVWGTPQSSGSFSKLFKSKLLKAKEYLENPVELQLDELSGETKAATQLASQPIHIKVTSSWEEFSNNSSCALVLNGDSSCLPIPDKVVDAVITDPPYFDFIHYSELSDFFFAWLTLVLKDDYPFFDRPSSYHKGEVQNKQPEIFATNLTRVFSESRRVLKDDGVLAFSFHHSRPDGWAAIYQALKNAGFYVVAAYPVYAEMAVASPKSSTKEPISVDVVLVCKKHFTFPTQPFLATNFVQELNQAGINLSRTDHFNIQAGLWLITASRDEMHPIEMQQELIRLKGEV